MSAFVQKIFFGPPGCGKSFRVREEAESKLGIKKGSSYMIETAFHPEYGYGDFVAKLLPKTEGGSIQYHIYTGPLIKALARAYAEPNREILLVIDEINRGSCAQIFGDIFQLLDRGDSGWSEYGIDLCELTLAALKQDFGEENQLPEELQVKNDEGLITGYKLRLPPKLSIIGTMNTSDESVYYMDTAFKRRWDFEYMAWEGNGDSPELNLQRNARVGKEADQTEWYTFLDKLNTFIAKQFDGRNVDDKQVGIWFLKSQKLPESAKHITQNIKTFSEQVKEDGETPSAEIKELLKILEQLEGHYELAEWKNQKGSDNNPYFSNAKAYFSKDGKHGKTVTEEALDCTSVKQKVNSVVKSPLADSIFKCKPSTLAAVLIKEINNNIPKKRNEETTQPDRSGMKIERHAIQNKLMFFLWDNVFSRDRTPLYKLLKDGGDGVEPRTFGEFTKKAEAFIKGVMAQKLEGEKAPSE